MNDNNILNLRQGSFGRIIEVVGTGTVFLPTVRRISNARVLHVDNESNSIEVHWIGNFNLNGDFSTELMKFNSDLMLDNGDLKARNKIRKANGLVEIK